MWANKTKKNERQWKESGAEQGVRNEMMEPLNQKDEENKAAKSTSPFRKFFPLEALPQCDMSRVQAKATAGPRKRILTSEYAPERITKIRRRFPE